MCEFFFSDCCSVNQSYKFVKSEHFSTPFVGTEKIFVKSENSLNQGSTIYLYFVRHTVIKIAHGIEKFVLKIFYVPLNFTFTGGKKVVSFFLIYY